MTEQTATHICMTYYSLVEIFGCQYQHIREWYWLKRREGIYK